jgi:hypothetical protein
MRSRWPFLLSLAGLLILIAPALKTDAEAIQPAQVQIYGPSAALAGESVLIRVQVPATTSVRKAVVSASRDGRTFAVVGSLPLRRGAALGSLPVGDQIGRLWLRVSVKGQGSRTLRIAVQNPYRPAAPDDATLPEAGIVVIRDLFGNHPIDGAPRWAGTVRLWDTATSWNAIEKAPGRYDWRALDAAVAQAEANNQSVLLVLGGTPSWAAVDQAPGAEFAGPGSSMPMREAGDFERYVGTVVERYGGRIAAYQIWNEANIEQFWRGTPELMADLTARAYDAIKRRNPQATVVAASTGSRWIKGFERFYPEYLKALSAYGWPFDAYGVHLYPMASGTPRDRAYLLGMFRNALQVADAPPKPIWETEINYGVTNPGLGDAARAIPTDQIPGYVARTYLDSLRFGIERSYWYAWTPDYRLLGIQMWNGLTAEVAYGQISEWVVGARFSGCQTIEALVTCNFDRAGQPFQIAYTDDDSNLSLPMPRGFTTATVLGGAPVPIAGTVAVGPTPVRLSP